MTMPLQGCHASGRQRQRLQDVRTRPTTPRTSAGRPPNRQSPAPTVGWMANDRSVRRSGWRSAGQTAWRTPPPGPSARGHPLGAVRQRPSATGRPLGPSAQPKLWSPITIDLKVRFKCVIPFWNVQVMHYIMGY
jgi:hypothetical protein